MVICLKPEEDDSFVSVMIRETVSVHFFRYIAMKLTLLLNTRHHFQAEMEKRADGADASVLFFLLGCANFLAVYVQIR